MKTIKVGEATCLQIDWLVAKCGGATNEWRLDGPFWWNGVACIRDFGHDVRFTPSTDWAQGGPIIERERLCVGYKHQPDPDHCALLDPATACWARTTAGGYLSYGPTPLIATMRSYVASKLGHEVEIPEEL